MLKEFGELRKFVAPEILLGYGAIEKCASYVINMGAQHVLLVSDNGLKKAGWTGRLESELNSNSINYTAYLDVSPNPRDFEVMQGVEIYLNNDCDMLVALGGGSVIDCAKGIGMVVSNGGKVNDYEGVDRCRIPIPPLVCIPSTAGSSADVSQFAIIENTEKLYKMAIISKGLVPDVSLIDPEVSVTMSAELTAETGIDALTHAFEAWVSNASSSLTDLHAFEAVKYIIKSLPEAVKNPADIDARTAMMLGSLHAGLAFSNASLGLVHSMAHSLGGLLDLPHGLCNALLLENVVKYNFSFASAKYRQLAELVSGRDLNKNSDAAAGDLLFDWLRNFRRELSIGDKAGMPKKDPKMIKQLAECAISDACIVTNPRVPTKPEIMELYGKIFE